MSQNGSSPLHLLQECVVAGGASDMDMSSSLPPRCQQRNNEESLSSPIDIFMDVLRTKTASIQPYFSLDSSSAATTAHSALIQDFNLSTKVWGGVSPRS
eukprot:CAMPEP_0172298586 /NCGR_PEP_ID=MMETSP1058-20130122/1174_1 /TAXON_ID=83371 /ORGANISM="Detonula confervacea, Strain CCMP 353" /LENGTH=98 /DNA_ID=CAMNT_0013007865 /DNA_START=124 /DNA_END=420 /DNA_ORIENTATION=+